MGRPYYDLGLPTTKQERVLGLPTLSYKKITISTEVMRNFWAKECLWAFLSPFPPEIKA
jgi:hypothetical protein